MQKLYNVAVILSCAWLVGCATTPSEITKVSEQTYKISGRLHQNEYDQIIDIVKQHQGQPLNFYVTSIGGNSADLIPAMDAVYQHGQVHWYVVEHCDSACAVMALATRHAHGQIKLHSFYSHRHHEVKAAPEYNERILDKLHSYGYNTDRIHHMFDSVEKLWTVNVIDGEIIYGNTNSNNYSGSNGSADNSARVSPQ